MKIYLIVKFEGGWKKNKKMEFELYLSIACSSKIEHNSSLSKHLASV